jgi:SAM-dependent methyltransferase
MSAAELQAWKRRTLDHWNRGAPYWNRWYDWYVDALGPLIEWSCRAAQVGPGSRVLDIACGTGEPALTAARRVGPTGSVLATDLSPEMVLAATQRAKAQGLENVRFAVMDAELLEVPAASFDAVTFACGLMFCPQPAAAIAGVRRALRPGGRFAISVWDAPALNAFVMIFGSAVAEVMGIPPPATGGPGPFRLADHDVFASVLREGGLTSFDIAPLPMKFPYQSVDHYLAVTTDFACGLLSKFDALSDEERARFKALVRGAAEPYRDGGGLRLPATPLCASGVVDS